MSCHITLIVFDGSRFALRDSRFGDPFEWREV